MLTEQDLVNIMQLVELAPITGKDAEGVAMLKQNIRDEIKAVRDVKNVHDSGSGTDGDGPSG